MKKKQEDKMTWNDPKVQEMLKEQICSAGERSTQEHQQYEKDLIEKGRKQGMVQGIALAINYSLRGNDEDAIWRSAGLSIEECISNKVDWYDLERLIHEFATIEEVELIANYCIANLEKDNDYHIASDNFIGQSVKVIYKSDEIGIKLHEQLAEIKQGYLDILKGNSL